MSKYDTSLIIKDWDENCYLVFEKTRLIVIPTEKYIKSMFEKVNLNPDKIPEFYMQHLVMNSINMFTFNKCIEDALNNIKKKIKYELNISLDFEKILKEYPNLEVTFQDSLDAGNCESESERFCRFFKLDKNKSYHIFELENVIRKVQNHNYFRTHFLNVLKYVVKKHLENINDKNDLENIENDDLENTKNNNLKNIEDKDNSENIEDVEDKDDLENIEDVESDKEMCKKFKEIIKNYPELEITFQDLKKAGLDKNMIEKLCKIINVDADRSYRISEINKPMKVLAEHTYFSPVWPQVMWLLENNIKKQYSKGE